ncbi:MAG: hypothetical protein ACR2ME_07545 [Acidimicrobiia bacterium]
MLVLFILAACGGVSGNTTEPGANGLAMCAPGVPDCVDVVIEDPTTGEVAVPTGNAVNPQPITEATVVSSDGNEVRFAVWMGVEPCDVIDRVEVTETDANVDVEIFRGTGDIAATCVAMAVERIVVVELAAPLGNRLLTLSGVALPA